MKILALVVVGFYVGLILTAHQMNWTFPFTGWRAAMGELVRYCIFLPILIVWLGGEYVRAHWILRTNPFGQRLNQAARSIKIGDDVAEVDRLLYGLPKRLWGTGEDGTRTYSYSWRFVGSKHHQDDPALFVYVSTQGRICKVALNWALMRDGAYDQDYRLAWRADRPLIAKDREPIGFIPNGAAGE